MIYVSGGPPSPSHRLKPSADSAVLPQPAPALPSLHPFVEAYQSIIHTYRGRGHGIYPTIREFDYVEEITFEPIPNKPLIFYRSRTWNPDSMQGMHLESGYLKFTSMSDDGRTCDVELLNAQATSITEISEGQITITHASDAAASNIMASTPPSSSSSSSSSSLTSGVTPSVSIVLVLQSQNISRSSSSKPPVTRAINRTFTFIGDTLNVAIDMETENTPLQRHLTAQLQKL
jgi:hypothetical protein